GEQAWQQLQRQGQQQAGKDDDPAGQSDLARGESHTASGADSRKESQSASLRRANIDTAHFFFRQVLMNALRSSPLRVFSVAVALQRVIFSCWVTFRHLLMNALRSSPLRVCAV